MDKALGKGTCPVFLAAHGQSAGEKVPVPFPAPGNLAAIERLRKGGVQFPSVEKREVPTEGDNTLAGKTFVFTGALSRPREKAEAIVKERGGRAASSVSKKTDYVVAGEKAGSKLAKAEKLGIPILSEEDFQKMLDGS